MKTCSKCKQEKENSEFSIHDKETGNVQPRCKMCRAKDEAERRKDPKYKAKIKAYKQDPKNRRQTKNMALKRLFGLSIEEYDKMYKKQNGLCAICFREEVAFHIRSLAVDHCHKTGKVRGLLCTLCNQGIGHLKDNIVLLESAIRYLKENENE